MKRTLITGGAGFIGSRLSRELLAAGHEVRALDTLSPQVHGSDRRRPPALPAEVELQLGDVRDPAAVARALDGVDAVYHLAALVGVGQSMYRIAEYTSVNAVGTAVLLDALKQRPVERLIVASSMSVYGEGLYRGGDGELVRDAERTRDALRAGRWEPLGRAGEPLTPIPTTEDKSPSLASVYALSKYDQERLCLVTARAYGFSATALRLFNVYGPHQALSNPYTGVLAIFGARLLNRRPPMLFEDGRQRRDFVSVHDVARAFVLALDGDRARAADGQVLNVGSGRASSVLEVARLMADAVGAPEIQPVVTGRHRAGDIRHCFADVTEARALLGFEAEVTLDRGLAELAAWLDGQVVPSMDRDDDARAELDRWGLTS